MSGPVLSAINAVNTEITSLRSRVDVLLAAMGEGEINATEIQAQIEAATQDAIDTVLAQLEGLDVSSLEHRMDLHKLVLTLKNVYGQEKFLFELFDTAFTVAEFFQQDVTAGVVAGDDSIDIGNTSLLEVGKEYQLEGDGNREVIEVKEILNTSRFKTVALIQSNYTTAAKVKRTTFDIGTTGQADATDGQVYYSGVVDLGTVDKDKALVVRRTDNDAVVRVWFKDDTRTSWTEMPWGWIRTDGVSGGYADHEYPCPARGDFRLKIQVEHGPSAQDVTFKHIVGVHEATQLGGTPRYPETPVNATPADGATDLMETPTLGSAGYDHILGAALAATRVQVSEAIDFATTVYDGTVGSTTMFSVPAGTLAISTTYYWRMRFMDENGAWSEWSDASSFSTASAFSYITTPSPTAPADGTPDVGETPTLQTSVFNAVNPTLVDLSTNGGTNWTDSATTAGEYHYGGANCPGKPSQVYIDGSVALEGSIGALAVGEWAWGDQDALGSDTLYVKIAGGDPDGQATGYIQRGEIHVATQWQIRTAAGTYAIPAYDSGESSDLKAHTVPEGILSDGGQTYYWRIRFKGIDIGLSEWSSEVRFATKEAFASIIGIALVQSGNGGAGIWQRVDADGNNANPDASFFSNHSVFGGIEDIAIDGQAMVKIPKFYYKVGPAPAGSDQAGKKCWWISDTAIGGFSVHPAFMDSGLEVEQFWIGKYEASLAGDGHLGSASGVMPYSSAEEANYNATRALATGRNTGGTTGFKLWDIYELSAIQMLLLIDIGTPDVQVAIGKPGYSAPAVCGSTPAVWRGIYELWGNGYYNGVDGFRSTPGVASSEIFSTQGDGAYVTVVGHYISQSGGMYDDSCALDASEAAGENYDLKATFLPGPDNNAGMYALGSFGDINYCTSIAKVMLALLCQFSHAPSYGGLFGLSLPASRAYTCFRLAKK